MIKLYGYFRSSAAFRVRIALNLKQLPWQSHSVNLKPGADQQFSNEFRLVNAQQRVPVLVDGDLVLSQSPAILEYLEERYSESALLPDDMLTRARVREFCQLIACDIHPLNNLSVLQKLKSDFGADQAQADSWYRHWIELGFAVLEQRQHGHTSLCCFSDDPGLAEVYLIPQVWNALRFDVDMSKFPRLQSIYQHCLTLPAFDSALPEQQPDNPVRQA